MPDVPLWLQLTGATMAVLGFAIGVWQLGYGLGLARGRQQANDDVWGDGWDSGYDRGWESCRDKAIEYGVGSL